MASVPPESNTHTHTSFDMFNDQLSTLDKDMLRKIGAPNIKRYGFSDFLLLLSLFVMGFLLSYSIQAFRADQKTKLDTFLQQYEGQRGEYERAAYKAQMYQKWKYRVKIAEKYYYVFLIVMGFVFYKSPSLTHTIIMDNAHLSIPLVSLSIIAFIHTGSYFEKREQKCASRATDLKRREKDIKMQLLTQLDPLVVETLREIVRNDMKLEIEDTRNHDRGCTKKCQLQRRISEKELNRNQKIVDALLAFEWCDVCSILQSGAVQTTNFCTSGCGQKFVRACAPLMRSYGREQDEL